MRLNVHAGHNPDGKIGSGAVGLIKESTEARAVKDYVVAGLKGLGHTVYDCTVDNGTSQNDILQKIVAKCNTNKVDLDVSIHFNCGREDMKGDGKSAGVEVYILSDNSRAKEAAERVCKEVSKGLGIGNRGVKVRTNLYVLKNTNDPAMLIECLFVDDKDDVDKYNAEKMAAAIVRGLVGNDPVKFEPYKAKVNTDLLNIRAGGSAKDPIVGQTKQGMTVTVLEEDGDWGRIEGWIHTDYIKKV